MKSDNAIFGIYQTQQEAENAIAALGAAVGVFLGGLVGALGGAHMFFNDNMTALMFCSLFGLFFGAASGALVGIGTPQSLRQRYLDSLQEGCILLSVHDRGFVADKSIYQILEETGASEIAEAHEASTWQLLSRATSSRISTLRASKYFP